MADPISSSTSTSTSANQCLEDDVDETASVGASTTPAAPLVAASLASSPAEDASACQAPRAVWSLVQQFPPSTFSNLPATTQQPGSESVIGYLHTESTTDGESVKTEVAFVKSNNPGGVVKESSVEVSGAVAQIGKDLNLELIGARSTFALSRGGYGVSVTADGPSVRGNLGEHNDDGSLGGNMGLGANLMGFEATLSTPVGSLTYGNGVSLNGSGSIGVRDEDHDGNPEYCAKFSVPAYTLGACLERFW
jgi:hypothetical protein